MQEAILKPLSDDQVCELKIALEKIWDIFQQVQLIKKKKKKLYLPSNTAVQIAVRSFTNSLTRVHKR